MKLNSMEARLVINRYQSNKRLCVSLEVKENGYWEPWSDITVNIPDCALCDEKVCAFIDTNNFPEALTFLAENELAYPTGIYAIGDWCSYPEYFFDMEKLTNA